MTTEREATEATPSLTEPPVRTHRWGFGAFLVVYAVFVLSAVVLAALIGTVAPEAAGSGTVVMLGTMVPTLLATATALLFTKLRGNGPKRDLRWSFDRTDVRAGFRFGVLGLVCTTAAAVLWTNFVGEENASSAVGRLVENDRMPLVAAIVMFLFVWLVAPICEEIIYRGLLWGALERLKWGRWAVFTLTTVIFAISHLEPLRTSLLLVIGIPIGLARLFTGRLGASVVAHQINNFLPALAVLLVAVGAMPA